MPRDPAAAPGRDRMKLAPFKEVRHLH